MKILDRYVLGLFLKNYLISFMVLIGLYVVLDMVFNFDELAKAQGSGAVAEKVSAVASALGVVGGIAKYYFFQSFRIFIHLSGIIPIVAAAFTLIRLTRFNELTASLAAGVPLLRVALPIVLAGVVLNVLLIVDQELLIPRMIPQLTTKHEEIGGESRWYPIRAMQDEDKALVNAARYHPPTPTANAWMDQVDVIIFDPGTFMPIAHIRADRGEWDPAKMQWNLTHGKIVTGLRPEWAHADGASPAAAAAAADGDAGSDSTADDGNGGASAAADGGDAPASSAPAALGNGGGSAVAAGGVQTRVTEAPIDAYPTTVTPDEIALFLSGEYVELLPTSRITMLLQRPKSYGTIDLQRVRHARFTQPLLNVVLLLLAIPCVISREPGRIKQGILLCAALCGACLSTVFLSHQLAGTPPGGADWADRWPAMMAWLPILIFGPVAVWLLDRVKT